MGSNGRRPENTELSDPEKDLVLAHVEDIGAKCHSCGGTDFAVGDALYLGFLFRSEDQDAYMVALTCKNPDCEVPHTGVHLHRDQFLRGASHESA
ncbi:hypothetical protein FOS14_04120 [Skermania sp. ID1734]|uniref:hypothetical protein n=1 Tax=Skermania sp. ID1734 TaxID=2597516 RepID=UPI0011806F19|nr:hypothetical protein [Skermania sp. ID1734]TSE00962.1 hypothetical protein FOS14_04120 [Skermania sp. ID1734]